MCVGGGRESAIVGTPPGANDEEETLKKGLLMASFAGL